MNELPPILAVLPSPSPTATPTPTLFGPSFGTDFIRGFHGPELPILIGVIVLGLLLSFAGRRGSNRPPWRLRSLPSGWASPRDLKQAGLVAPKPESWPGRLFLADRMGVYRVGRSFRQRRANLSLQPGRSAIVIGPTESGKTSSVVIPALVRWGAGAVVATSTKPDILRTWQTRSQYGPCWLFDPTGSVGRPDLCVGWSALWRCQDWDNAVEAAAAMMAPQAQDLSAKNAGHFAQMGRQLMAPLLHAAALRGTTMREILTWVYGWNFGPAMEALQAGNATTAQHMLLGIQQLGDGEHVSGIRGTVMVALSWLARDSVQASVDPARFPQLDIDRLLLESGTLFIVSPRDTMDELAPLTSALVDAVTRRALQLAVAAGGRLSPRLLLALDEAANISPIHRLPGLLAEGGQQGITCLVSLQDISQAYNRWGRNQTNTMWSNAAARLVLPGLADPASQELVSDQAGEVERWYQSVSDSSRGRDTRSDSWATRWEPVIRPDELGRMNRGDAILLARGLRTSRLFLTPMRLDGLEHDLPARQPVDLSSRRGIDLRLTA